MKRKVQYTTQSTLSILIILVVLIIINIFSQTKFARWDLTANKQYTISPSTKKIIGKLDDIVNVKLYFSKNLPPVLQIQERRIKDLLDEYRAYSKGKIVIKKEDPSADQELETKVKSIGIPQVQMTYRQKDEVEVKNGYFGMAIFYGGKKEVIPIIQDEDNLEYDLTSAIRKVTSDTIMKIGFSTGHDERDVEKDYSLIKGALNQQYETTMVTISDTQPIPSDITTLIIAGPKKDFTERELYQIDQYIMKGGKLIVLMEMVQLNLEMGLFATPMQNKLNNLLDSYGIKVNSDLVLDKYNDRLTYSESPDNRIQYVTTVNYPFFVKAIKKNFAENNPILRGLESITVPWACSLTLNNTNLKTADVVELVKTSEFSWVQKDTFNLNPKQQFVIPPDQEKQSLLAAVITNEFTSYFKGKEIPRVNDEKDNEAKPSVEKIIEKSPKTNILVVGNSYFITVDSLRRFQSNAVFFLNSVDWITQGEALIGIRSRAIKECPIEEVGENTKSVLKFVNIFGGSIVIVIFGLLVFYWRKRERKMYESMMSQ